MGRGLGVGLGRGVALGVPGILAYGAVLILAFHTLYRVASARRDALALMALGIASVLFMHWLNGGQYAAAILPWLALGWADRQHRDQSLPAARQVEQPMQEAQPASGRLRSQR